MKNSRREFKNVALVIIPLLLPLSFFQKVHKQVNIIGDSTMCSYGPEASPITGWGMPFTCFFDSTVTVRNDGAPEN